MTQTGGHILWQYFCQYYTYCTLYEKVKQPKRGRRLSYCPARNYISWICFAGYLGFKRIKKGQLDSVFKLKDNERDFSESLTLKTGLE